MESLGIILGSAAALVVAALLVMRRQERAGYVRYIAAPATLQKEVAGRFTRNGERLSLFGGIGGRPCELAVMGTDAAPEISVRVAASAPFNLSVFPARINREVAGKPVRSGSIRLNSNFRMFASDAKMAELFLKDTDVIRVLEKLMSSANTELKIAPGAVEFSEIMPMAPVAQGHLSERAKLVAALAVEVSSLPGARQPKMSPIAAPPRFRHGWVWVTGLLGIVVVSAIAYSNRQSQAEVKVPQKFGFEAFHGLENWTPLPPEQFESSLLGHLRQAGAQAAQPVRISCAGAPEDAYLLNGKAGERKIAIIRFRKVVYDRDLSSAYGIVKIPQYNLKNIVWSEQATPDADPEGDGFLVVKEPEKPGGGQVYFCNNKSEIVTGVPQDYRDIALR